MSTAAPEGARGVNQGVAPVTYGTGDRPPRGDYGRARSDYTCEQDHGRYTAADHETYRRLHARQLQQLPGLACDAFIAAVGQLGPPEQIPRFDAISERLLRATKTVPQLTWVDTLIIGSFQVLALLPGVSRSGTTIAAGLGRGLDRPSAARFSFLVGLPAIAGAGLLSILDIFTAQGSLPMGHYLAAFVTAAAVGYLCIAFLLNWVKRHTLYPFAIYCAVVGTVYVLFTLL